MKREEPNRDIGYGTERQFIANNRHSLYLLLGKRFGKERNKIPGYIGEKYYGGWVFRAFGTNLTFTPYGSVIIPGNEAAIREARKGIEKSLGIKLIQVVD